jgi:6-phosphofructokinase 2
MQEEYVSKAISGLEGTSLAIMTSGGSTGEMLKSFTRGISAFLRLSKPKVGHRKISSQYDDKFSVSVCFPAPPVTTEKRQNYFNYSKLDFNYLVLSGGLSEGLSVDFIKK